MRTFKMFRFFALLSLAVFGGVGTAVARTPKPEASADFKPKTDNVLTKQSVHNKVSATGDPLFGWAYCGASCFSCQKECAKYGYAGVNGGGSNTLCDAFVNGGWVYGTERGGTCYYNKLGSKNRSGYFDCPCVKCASSTQCENYFWQYMGNQCSKYGGCACRDDNGSGSNVHLGYSKYNSYIGNYNCYTYDYGLRKSMKFFRIEA